MPSESNTSIDHEEKWLRERGIDVRLECLGALTGEFPTIIVAIVSAIIGGMLGAMGEDLWQALKAYLKKRVKTLEVERKAKVHTLEGRFRVLTVYVVTENAGIPVVYFAAPEEDNLELEYDPKLLKEAEADIVCLIGAGKITKELFLGINVRTLGSGCYLQLFEEIPSEGSIINEILSDPSKVEVVEGYVHVLVGTWLEEIGKRDRARLHYEIALLHLPEDPKVRVSLGWTFAEEGDLSSALEQWNAALAIDGRHDILHYNLACYWSRRNDTGEAARELREAITHGWSDAGAIRSDPDLTPVLESPEIQEILHELEDSLRKKEQT